MAPLDDAVAGRKPIETITWSDNLRTAIQAAQHALSTNCSIALASPDYLLWIVTDGAVREPGIPVPSYK